MRAQADQRNVNNGSVLFRLTLHCCMRVHECLVTTERKRDGRRLRRGADGASLEVSSGAEGMSLSYQDVQNLEVVTLQELLRCTGLHCSASDRNVLLGQINTHVFGVMRRARSQRLLPRVPGVL